MKGASRTKGMAKSRKPDTARKAPTPTTSHGEIEDWIEHLNPDVRAIAQRVDDLIRQVIPGLQYAVKWRKAHYGLPEQGWIIALSGYIVSVNIEFFAGADFDPPPPQGEGRARYVKLMNVEEAEEPMIRRWIEQAGRARGWV